MGWSIDAPRACLMVAMLFLFMLINFADKAVLGLSALPIMQELALTHTRFGLIGSSFFALFSLSAVVVGFLSNRVPSRWVLAAIVLVWSLCQLPMMLPVTAGALVATRVILGAGEGPACPVALHAAFKWSRTSAGRCRPASSISVPPSAPESRHPGSSM